MHKTVDGECHTDCEAGENADRRSVLLALCRLVLCLGEGNLRASAQTVLFLQCGLYVLWDLHKATASKCNQPPLTTAFSSTPQTRLLSKQSVDSLINRGVHRGALRHIFSHLLTLISFAWTFMRWTCNHRSPSVHKKHTALWDVVWENSLKILDVVFKSWWTRPLLN